MAITPQRPAGSPPPAREVEVEVLPKSAAAGHDPLSAFIARIMDSLFTVPGTKIKVGLDPIIGLVPFFGAGTSAVVSLLLLLRSAQAGVPNAVLARMVGNIIINSILDDVPVIGDFLSIFFRSNKMNYELLEKHAGTRQPLTPAGRLAIFGLLFGAVAFVVCALIGLVYLTGAAWHALFGAPGS